MKPAIGEPFARGSRPRQQREKAELEVDRLKRRTSRNGVVKLQMSMAMPTPRRALPNIEPTTVGMTVKKPPCEE
jgi:hypothetical protein